MSTKSVKFTPKPLPMKEAISFWKGKTPVTSDEFATLSADAKDKAFTVGGIVSQDLISTIYGKLGEAVESGMTYREWKNSLSDVWDEAGWTEDNSYRLDNIFRTNIQSAFGAGRYKQMSRVKKLRPYWQYDAVNDSSTREDDAVLDGKVLHADDPFWDVKYPPNGYRCRCGIKSLSERQLKKRGLKVEKNLLGKDVEWINPETGEVKQIRIMPDNVFNRAPGKSGLEIFSPSETTDEIKNLLDSATCKKKYKNYTEDDSCLISLKDIDDRHILPVTSADILPKGLKPEAYVKTFLKEFGIDDLDGSKVVKITERIPVVISKQLFIDKRSRNWKVTNFGREPYMKLLARTINNPFEVWSVPASVAGKPTPVLRLMRLFQTSEKKVGGFVVFNLVRGRLWHAATAFTPKVEAASENTILEYLEKQRKGVLIYRETLK